MSTSTPADPITPPPCSILYAEDEKDDVFFFKRAMKAIGSPCILQSVPDGEQAMHYLSGNGVFTDRTRHPLPALVLLDINMPKKSGFEVLKWIRQQPHFKSLPVLMLTSSSRPEDREVACQLGAQEYLLKPSDPKQLAELVKTLHDRWLPNLPPSLKSSDVGLSGAKG